MNTQNQFKVVLSGPSQSGKTKFAYMLKNGEDTRTHYLPTVGAEVYPVKVETNQGEIKCTLWDTAGNPRLGGLRDGYFLQADGFIFFYNSDSQISELKQFMVDAYRVSPNAKVYVCYTGNESTNYSPAIPLGANVHEPLDVLIRKMSGNNNITVEATC